MKRNQFLAAILSCALVLGCLSGCGAQAKPHTHSPADGWHADAGNHWRVCACGESFDSAAHTMDGDICSVCGSEVLTYEDGAKYLTVCNDRGDWVTSVYYNADGSEHSREQAEYVYGQDGNLTQAKYYSGDTLYYEAQYAVNGDGALYTRLETYYDEDGSKNSTAYDEMAYITQVIYYTPDGSVEYSYTYEYSEDHSSYLQKDYEGDVLVMEQEFRTDSEGWERAVRTVLYNEDGSFTTYEYDDYGNELLEAVYTADGTLESDLSYENVYDLDGNLLLRRTYEGGILTREVEYVFGSDGEGSWISSGKTTIYHDDGSKTVQDSDLDGTWSTEVTYAEDGSILDEMRYEYLFDENGESIGSRGYHNGRLSEETMGWQTPEGEPRLTWINYHEDGTKTVREYGEHLDLISKITYDAQDNIISES